MLINVVIVQLVLVISLTADVLVDANRVIQKPVIARKVRDLFYVIVFYFWF